MWSSSQVAPVPKRTCAAEIWRSVNVSLQVTGGKVCMRRQVARLTKKRLIHVRDKWRNKTALVEYSVAMFGQFGDIPRSSCAGHDKYDSHVGFFSYVLFCFCLIVFECIWCVPEESPPTASPSCQEGTNEAVLAAAAAAGCNVSALQGSAQKKVSSSVFPYSLHQFISICFTLCLPWPENFSTVAS